MIEVSNGRGKSTRHDANSWGYPGTALTVEFAVACSCGFNHAGLETVEEAEAMETSHWKAGFAVPFQQESLYTKKGEEVITTMSDAEARDALVKLGVDADNRGRPNNFAGDLVRGFEKYKGWTEGQRPWAHKLANEHLAPKPERKLTTETFPRLVAMMQLAASNLKRPKITFNWEGRTVQLSIAGNTARVPGSLNVTDGGPYGESIWYGRIVPTGEYDAGRANENWVTQALVALDKDPAASAAEHGHRTGRCCFCNIEIRTNESLAVGYGPVCADHYGLPWG